MASTLTGDTFARNAQSVRAFHHAVLICAALVAGGGVAGALGITNPRRTVRAEGCPGGQLTGAGRLYLSAPGFLKSDLTPAGSQFVSQFATTYGRALQRSNSRSTLTTLSTTASIIGRHISPSWTTAVATTCPTPNTRFCKGISRPIRTSQ